MTSLNTNNFKYNSDFNDFHLPWSGHKYFARDLISIIKPKLVVELGTYKGTSFLSFVEGIESMKMDTVAIAIDTWEEDSESGVYQGDLIKKNLEFLLDKHYSKVNSKLIQDRFENVVSQFEDYTIDILHIDGWHTYEAVKTDYNTWKKKVSKNGLILFHDIKVIGSNFGVHKFWDEIKKNKKHLEFNHSHGLGLLFMNENSYFDEINENFIVMKEKYLQFSYESVKTQLYFSNKDLKELKEIKNSKYWKIKALIKNILRR